MALPPVSGCSRHLDHSELRLIERVCHRLASELSSSAILVPVGTKYMPIGHLLKERQVRAEDSERLTQAFDLALKGLQLVDRNDPVCEIVARKVIEIGLDGTRNPQEIAEQAVKQLGP
jgi:hypothetical protein